MDKVKKGLKTYLLSILLSLIFVLGGCGSNQAIIDAHIGDAIAISGDLQHYIDLGYEERNSQCKEQHIEVSGTLDEKYTSQIYYLGNKKENGLRFTCWFDEAPEGIEEGDYLVIDGVCIYSFDDELVIKGCRISQHATANDKETEDIISTEKASDDSNEKQDENSIEQTNVPPTVTETTNTGAFDLTAIPTYSGKAYVAVNDNVPFFTDTDMITTSYEYYSNLDSQGRCGVCVASVGTDIMPTEERGTIGNVKPSGWNQTKYAGVVDGNYLYNRCHLIGYQLTGENANTKNLITGTRYLNIEGMLPFENMVADYVKETKNHVIYRVTPIFEGSNLLASGVLMEAKSVEDNGDGILYCVYCYNVQPGVGINYADGSSWLEDSVTTAQKPTAEPEPQPKPEQSSDTMVWLSATGSKYHSINNCGRMNPSKATQVTESEAISKGMEKCSKCW